MKLISMFFDAAIEDVVQETLRNNGIDNYVKVPKVLGKLDNCDPLLDSHIWPGYILCYLIPMESLQLEEFRPALKELNGKYSNKGFKALLFEAEEII